MEMQHILDVLYILKITITEIVLKPPFVYFVILGLISAAADILFRRRRRVI